MWAVEVRSSIDYSRCIVPYHSPSIMGEVLTREREFAAQDSRFTSQQFRQTGNASRDGRPGIRNLLTEALIVALLLVVIALAIAGGNFSRDRTPNSVPRSIPRSIPR